MNLKEMRARAYRTIRQEEGGLNILWRVRPVDPAALFKADALISALYSITSAATEAGADDLAEAERLAKNADGPRIEQQRAELDSQQTIARDVVKEISTDNGETWRAVEWVDNPDQELDEQDQPLKLHIGWISRQTLTEIVWSAGVRIKEETGDRFRDGRSE